MSESKHTPGPWKWSTNQTTENRSLTGTEKYTGHYGEHIPIIYLHEGFRSEAEKQANMNLIAVAPETKKQRDVLLEACKKYQKAIKLLYKLNPDVEICIDSGLDLKRAEKTGDAAIELAEKEG